MSWPVAFMVVGASVANTVAIYFIARYSNAPEDIKDKQ